MQVGKFVPIGAFATASLAVGITLLPINARPSYGVTASASTATRSQSALGAGTEYTYALPSNNVMQVPVPPSSFNPLTATTAALAEYDFPAKPTDSAALAQWNTAMSAYRSDSTAPAATVTMPPEEGTDSKTTWAGYVDGKPGVVANTYDDVKATIVSTVNINLCTTTGARTINQNSNAVGAWVGLGGTPVGSGTASLGLVQEGIECGIPIPSVPQDGNYHPFTEFAPDDATSFCGYTSWTVGPGDSIYNDMRFSASGNMAYFFLEDVTTGVAHTCNVGGPYGWSYDGNTAEWIVEGQKELTNGQIQVAQFQPIPFSGAIVRTTHDQTWHTVGSQPLTGEIMSSNPDTTAPACAKTWGLNADDKSFTVHWYQSPC